MSANADLFKILFTHLKTKGVTLSMTWMPSHTAEKEGKVKVKPDWLQQWHVQANAYADTLATLAAKEHQISPEVAKPILQRLAKLKAVQLRLSFVLSQVASRQHPNKEKALRISKAERLQAAAMTSTHTITFSDSRISCAACKASVSVAAGHAADFVQAQCPGELLGTCISVAVGKQHSHPTHNLRLYGGLLMCSKCGAIARNRLILLANVCKGFPKHQGDLRRVFVN
jgi:hypothetical protein